MHERNLGKAFEAMHELEHQARFDINLNELNKKVAEKYSRALKSKFMEKGILLQCKNHCFIIYLIPEPMERPKMAGLPATPSRSHQML